MKLAAISDLHIGARERTDGFRHDEAAFLSFLDGLEAAHDRIVVLGDLFQAEHGWWFGDAIGARELAAAQHRAAALWQRVQRAPYIYIHGNHDHVAQSHAGARTSWRVIADGFAVLFIHGHQFDPMLRFLYPAARFGTWFSGRARSVGLGRFADWLEHKDVVVKAQRFSGPGGPYARAARRLLRHQRVDAVVMGHTHTPERVDLPEGVLANTGTCSLGQRMYVTIDTARRSVDVVVRP